MEADAYRYIDSGLCSSDYHFMRDDWGFSTAPGVDVVGHEGEQGRTGLEAP